MSSPKVVVIGAGSYFFARPVIWKMTSSPVLTTGTLSLVDTNPEVLGTMMKLADAAIKATGAQIHLEGSTDRREVLSDADFVVFTFSEKNAYYRGVDTEIAFKHGVRMCSSDTIGPGGVFRALREIPTALEISRDVASLAPDSWVINFVNPTTIIGIALMRHASIRSFAICDGHHEPHNRLKVLKAVGILGDDAAYVPAEVEQKLDLRMGGVNHFTWMTKFSYDGVDMMPRWRENLAEKAMKEREGSAGVGKDSRTASKARFNANYGLQLMDIFGAYPDNTGHTKEYVPYFQGYGASPCDPEPITLFDQKEREDKMAQHWRETEDYAEGRKPIEDFIASGSADHATDIIESMWGNIGKPFFINTANRRGISNLSDDAFLELRCDLDMQGPRPQPMGELPRGILGLTQQILDAHELTAEAAVTCDRSILLRALATDPIVNNLQDARNLMEEMLEKERDSLPEKWF